MTAQMYAAEVRDLFGENTPAKEDPLIDQQKQLQSTKEKAL